jgi:uncharacterized membrane protein
MLNLTRILASRSNLIAAALLLMFSSQPGHGQTPVKAKATPRYQFAALPLRPNCIANSGWIAGMAPDQKAALVNPRGELVRISLPPEFTLSEALSVNSKGEAVGYGITADSTRRVAFLFREEKVVLLPGEQARAYSINDAGEIAGQAKIPGQKTVGAVLWKIAPSGDYAIVDLKICCAGTAHTIDAHSVIVGDVYDAQGRYHAFVWDAQHGARRMAVPGEEYSSVLAANNQGQAVLRVSPAGLMRFADGKFEPLDLPQADPRAINDAGAIVGPLGPSPEVQKAFVWDKAHGIYDLNEILPAKSDWSLLVATGINDHGEIVGWGQHGLSENAGFLLRSTGN